MFTLHKWTKTEERSKCAHIGNLPPTKDARRCSRSLYLLTLSAALRPLTLILYPSMAITLVALTLSCSSADILATPPSSVITRSSACQTTAVLKSPSVYATIRTILHGLTRLSQLAAVGALLEYLSRIKASGDLEHEGIISLDIQNIELLALWVPQGSLCVLPLTASFSDQVMQINADALTCAFFSFF